MQGLPEQLRDIGVEFSEREPLSLHSTFRIGGYAEIAVFPKTEQELISAVGAAERCGIRYAVIGRGSNVLFADSGYRGMIVFTSGLAAIRVEGHTIHAGCGASLRQIALTAAQYGLAGFAFAHGIPGSFGGAIYMNAGAFGGVISDVLASSTCFDPEDGSVSVLVGEQHEFGNKHSVYMDNRKIILGGELLLEDGSRSLILSDMDEMMQKRRATQPLELPSAGSVFKRPEGYYAGKLIEDAGLKGFRVGGAEVSRKHAGFIVNAGGATAADVLELIQKIQDTIKERYGVALEPEVRYIV